MEFNFNVRKDQKYSTKPKINKFLRNYEILD